MRESKGYLRQVRPGVWRCEYYLGGIKQKSINVEAKGKKDAWELVDAEKDERKKKATEEAANPWPIDKLLHAWLNEQVPTLKSPLSRSLYRYQVEHYVLPNLPAKAAGDLTSMDVMAMKDKLMAKHAPSLVHSAMARLTSALEWACNLEPPLLARNVARKVKRPIVPINAHDYFTTEELHQMLAVAKPPKRCAIALGMLGLRRGELIGLLRTDLDLKEEVIHLERQQMKVPANGVSGKRVWLEKAPKNGGTGDIPIPAFLLPIIREHLEWSMQIHNQTNLMFVSPKYHDRPVKLDAPLIWVREVCRDAGIDCAGRTFHSLRDSFVELARSMHIPDRDIAHVGRWKNTQQIVERYGNHKNERRNREVARAFDEALSAENVAQNIAQGSNVG